KKGYDIPLTRAVSDAVSIPVIASGGAGKADHMVEAITEGHASAVLAASIFHFGLLDMNTVKQHMADHGLEVRIP
ncbi:MAG: HisA/HisF-related TIM barrel protein, partial [Candidatus Puniceispirillales bacterium]